METKFNFKSQIATSIEQSERLLALGLKKETADMKHIPYSSDVVPKRYDDGFGFNDSEYVPAWSLGRLIEIKVMKTSSQILLPLDNTFDGLIEDIETRIKGGYFNKEYLV